MTAGSRFADVHARRPHSLRVKTAALWLLLALFLASGRSAPPVEAQQNPSGTDAFETIQVRPNVFVIFGGGANVTVQIGPEGALVVDTGTAAMADKVLSAMRHGFGGHVEPTAKTEPAGKKVT